MAEDCLPPQLLERLLWRKQTLKSLFSAAATVPTRTLVILLNLARVAPRDLNKNRNSTSRRYEILA